MTEHKDVVVALMGASAAFGALVLVFLGFVLTTYQGFDPTTPKRVLDRYRSTANWIVVAFVAGLVCVVLCAAWLVQVHPPDGLYLALIVLFFVQLVSLLGSAMFAVYRLFR